MAGTQLDLFGEAQPSLEELLPTGFEPPPADFVQRIRGELDATLALARRGGAAALAGPDAGDTGGVAVPLDRALAAGRRGGGVAGGVRGGDGAALGGGGRRGGRGGGEGGVTERQPSAGCGRAASGRCRRG